MQSSKSFLIPNDVISSGKLIKDIHDSIATTQGNEDFVKRVLEEELLKATGYLPKLSTEVWHPSLMKFSDNKLFIGEEVIAA